MYKRQILNRCIYETQINILYFLKNGEENSYKNYVKNSLITEKEFYKNIEENIKNRNGQELPIEKSMKKSISNSFEISDFEIEELNKSSNWKNLKKRLEKVDITNNLSQTYNIFYGLSSHAIHGNWQDLIQHHINPVSYTHLDVYKRQSSLHSYEVLLILLHLYSNNDVLLYVS